MKKTSHNQDYFEKIDSEDKAYFLGLMYADGYNYTKGISKFFVLALQEEDKDILEKFKLFLNSDNELYFIDKNSKNPNWKNQLRLQISGKKISNDLSKLGCMQAKTDKLLFPGVAIVSKDLIRHFIRGYFDGDGSVWEGQRKIINILDKTKKYGRRDRVIHNKKFNITGTISIIEGIQNELISSLGFKKNVLNTSKRKPNCIQLEYSGRLQMEKFYHYLYDNSIVWMNRKKLKFESIINQKI